MLLARPVAISNHLIFLTSLFRLYVLQGTPTEVLPRIFKEWNITRLTFEMDTEPYAKQRDAEVCQLAGEHGVEVIRRVSHTLYVTDR